VAQAILIHGLTQGCCLGANFLSLCKEPRDPAIELEKFASLLASYKLKGITKARYRIKLSPTLSASDHSLCRLTSAWLHPSFAILKVVWCI
jgi:hypothetical protein